MLNMIKSYICEKKKLRAKSPKGIRRHWKPMIKSQEFFGYITKGNEQRID